MPDDTKSKDTQNYIVKTKRGYDQLIAKGEL
jgi:hypothetical protein